MERKITIQDEHSIVEDYQMQMLKANPMERVLKMRGRGIDGQSYFDYDVSGKISMQAIYEGKKLKADEIENFLQQLKETIENLEEYLLDIHKLLLKPEYIFYENNRFYFCYFPYARQSFWLEFHELCEYLVKVTDYDDKLGARMTMQLHTDSAKENYSFEKVIADCLKLKKDWRRSRRKPNEDDINEENFEEVYLREEDLEEEDLEDDDYVEFDFRSEKVAEDLEEYGRKSNSRYDSYFHDSLQKATGDNLLKEQDHFWLPMKGFLRKHRRKREKWGDWDDLYADID